MIGSHLGPPKRARRPVCGFCFPPIENVMQLLTLAGTAMSIKRFRDILLTDLTTTPRRTTQVVAFHSYKGLHRESDWDNTQWDKLKNESCTLRVLGNQLNFHHSYCESLKYFLFPKRSPEWFSLFFKFLPYLAKPLCHWNSRLYWIGVTISLPKIGFFMVPSFNISSNFFFLFFYILIKFKMTNN